MQDENPESKPPALQSAHPPALAPGTPPATQGLDWKGFWTSVKGLVLGGKKLGEDLDETTQTPADDVLLGKTGIVTAQVGPGKAGEIRIPIRGGTQDYIACAQAGFTQTMEVNSRAEVVAFMPPNTVYVEPR
jgi:hypothetical protein